MVFHYRSIGLKALITKEVITWQIVKIVTAHCINVQSVEQQDVVVDIMEIVQIKNLRAMFAKIAAVQILQNQFNI